MHCIENILDDYKDEFRNRTLQNYKLFNTTTMTTVGHSA